MFKKPFSFKGRIRRTEYVFTLIINAFISSIIMAIAGGTREGGVLILYAPFCWFGLAQAVKRSHDLDNTGWYILIPFYGFWLLFAEGTRGNNKYGEDPKAVVNNRADSFSPPYVSPHNNMPQNDFRYEGGHNGNGTSEYNTQQSSQYNHASQQLPYTDSKKVGFQKGDNIYGKKY